MILKPATGDVIQIFSLEALMNGGTHNSGKTAGEKSRNYTQNLPKTTYDCSVESGQ